MKQNTKIIIVLVALIASMFVFITYNNRVLSMILLVVTAYLLGRFHGEKIEGSKHAIQKTGY